MVEWMDRGAQRRMLEYMAHTYPQQSAIEADHYPGLGPDTTYQNVRYLHDSGLCEIYTADLSRRNWDAIFTRATITNKGLDFLQDDGGLSAILNVVTVRFEADTLRALIADKIDASSEPEEKKAEAKKRLLGLKEEGLKAAVGKVVELGLGNIPTAASWFLSIT